MGNWATFSRYCKRLLWHVFLLGVVAIVGITIWFYLTHLNHQFRFESAATRSCESLEQGKPYAMSMNTYQDGILSQEIIDIYLSTTKIISNRMGHAPKIISWQDEIGYPGLIAVWDKGKGHIRLGVFQANDNDSIYVASSLESFSLPPYALKWSDAQLEDLGIVIDRNRIKSRRWSEMDEAIDEVIDRMRRKKNRE